MSPVVAGIIVLVVFTVIFIMFGINPSIMAHRRRVSIFSRKRYLKNGQPRSAKCNTLVRAKCIYFTDMTKNKSDFEHERRMAVYEVTYAGETYQVNDRNLRLHKNTEIGTIRDAYINPDDKDEIYIEYGPEEFTKAQKIVFYLLLAFVAVGLIAAVIGITGLFSK